MTQRSTVAAWLRHPVDVPLRIAVRVATVPIWVVASVPLALLLLFLPFGLPIGLGNIIFFGPQLLSFEGVVRSTPSGTVRLFAGDAARYAFAAYWLVVAIAHFVVTRRWKVSRAFAMGLVAVVVAAVLKYLVFSALGYHLEIDAP